MPMTLYSSFVPFVLTGNTTETLMAQVTIPDGVMGPNSRLTVEAAWQWTNNGNTWDEAIPSRGVYLKGFWQVDPEQVSHDDMTLFMSGT